MSVIAISVCEGLAVGSVKWLFEDIWLDNRKGGEIHIEGIINIKDVMESIHIFIPHKVSRVEDETSDCRKLEFVKGYTECWPSVYQQYEHESAEKGQHLCITVNGVTAVVGEVYTRIVLSEPECSEIEINFTPSVKQQSRIFRVVAFVEDFIAIPSSLLPRSGKKIGLFTYGLAAFGGGSIANLLRERQVGKKNIYSVEKHHMQVSFWGINVSANASRSPTQSFVFTACRNPYRYCPPLFRQARRLGIPIEKLKDSPNSYMHWFESNVRYSDGDSISVVFVESKVQAWLKGHWLALLSLLIALTSLTIAIYRLFKSL
jgi:hypothetical protein